MNNWKVVCGLFAVSLLVFGGMAMVASGERGDVTVPSIVEYGISGNAAMLCPAHDPECNPDQNGP